MQNKKSLTTRKMALISMLGAIGGVLMFFEISVPFIPPFYKLDFSDVPTLIGTFIMGPAAGVIIEALKIIIKLILKSTSTAFVGEMTVFIGSCIFIMAVYFTFYKAGKTQKAMVYSLIAGVLVRVLWACFSNVFISLPMYAKVYGWPMSKLVALGTAVNGNITSLFTFVLFAIVPFNFIKYSLVSVVTAGLYKALAGIIVKERGELR